MLLAIEELQYFWSHFYQFQYQKLDFLTVQKKLFKPLQDIFSFSDFSIVNN